MLSTERDGNLSPLFLAEATVKLNTKAIACALRQAPPSSFIFSLPRRLLQEFDLPIGLSNSRQKYTILLELRRLATR